MIDVPTNDLPETDSPSRSDDDVLVLRSGQVAWACRTTHAIVRAWADRGLLAAFRIPGGKHWRFRADVLREFMRQHGYPTGRLSRLEKQDAAAAVSP